MRPALLLVVLLALAALAGCVANPIPRTASAEPTATSAIPANWYEAALERDVGHNHRDRTQHLNMSTANFQLVGHDPVVTRDSNNRLVGGWGCGETGERADGRALAIMDGFGTTAHIIVDVTNPSDPEKVGTITMSGVTSWDDTITPDGRFAVIGLTSLARSPPRPLAGLPLEPVRAEFTDACGQTRAIALPDIAVTSGVMLFDLADPSRPVYADYWPAPAFNMHSVSAAIVDGRTYVTASTVQLVHTPSYFEFLELLDTPAGAKLVYLSAFAPPPVALGEDGHAFVPTQNGHNDVTIAKHPIDGKTYAYLAAWDGGMITLDMTVPQAPVMVSQWTPPTSGLLSSALSDDCQAWGIHTTYPLPDLGDGRHYVVAGQECPFHSGAGTPAGQLFIVDMTDTWTPTLTGRWNLPESTGSWTIDYQASPHYVAAHGTTLFVSMYHAGIWAIDLSGDLTAPPSIGVFMPDRPSGVNNPNSFGGLPSTEQVNVLSNGDIVVFENASGVYVLRFDATNPAPAALPFFR